ncbi:hypothetical protein BH11VER1_BH11VER1_06780 [soil metagenome]
MIELIREAFGAHNIIVTMMLGLVVFYWLLVMAGAVDFDLDLFDFGDADVEATPEIPDAHDSSVHLGGAWLTAGKFLGFSQVPMVVWGSFLTLSMWAISLVLNYQYNGEPGNRELTTSLMLLAPNFIGSLILTKLATLPVAKLFAAMSDADNESEEVVGRIGTVVSTEVDAHYGQLEIIGKGAPLLVNVRLDEGATRLSKGDSAKVVSAAADQSFYYVKRTPQSA